ncbi:MAG: hypothetical protein ACI934_000755 [Pseudohongiellaceae bacterium]|jgi:hypothetical protein
MRNRAAINNLLMLTSLLFLMMGTPLSAQSAEQNTPVRPTPRLANGQVNLGLEPGQKGFWGSSGRIFDRRGRAHQSNLLEAELPLQPWARALLEYRQANNEKDDPHARCLPGGITRQIQTVNGFEILQHPELNRIYLVFGGGPHTWRMIHTDGRPLPDINDPDLIPTYLGYSTAHWEDDTLVVETNGFNEKTWFASGSLPSTRFLHLTERISRPDFETLRYELTVDDPGAFTETWTGGFDVAWNWTSWDGSDNAELHEYFCQDNERDVQHFLGNE